MRVQEIVAEGAARLGLRLPGEALEAFAAYARLLLSWNARINLTGARTEEELAVAHFLDSLSALWALELPAEAEVADVGSGAGFPGVPLKLARPGWRMVLLEATGKKATFLRALVAELGLTGVEVRSERAEDFGRADGRERFDLVLARALAPLDILAELCLPLARLGGRALAWKGPRLSEEEAAGRRAAEALGAEVEGVWAVAVPGLEADRRLWVARKIRPTPARYPRPMGQIRARPLGRGAGRERGT